MDFNNSVDIDRVELRVHLPFELLHELRRVAAALEKMAARDDRPPKEQLTPQQRERREFIELCQQNADKTPFPWKSLRTDVVRRIHEYWLNVLVGVHGYHHMGWPLSCEELMEIGCAELSQTPRVGEVTLREIHRLLRLKGFDGFLDS